MLQVLQLPERFPAVLTGLPGIDEPERGELVPPMLAKAGDYLLDESDQWVQVTEDARPAGSGYTVVPTAGGPVPFPRGRHAWVWARRDLEAHLARSGGVR